MQLVPFGDRTDVQKIILVGKIYAASAPEIQEAFMKALQTGAKHIVLDCSSLEQVDSTILSTFIAGLKRVKAHQGGKVIFLAAGEHIKRILSLTKMDQFFPMAGYDAAVTAALG